MLVVGLLVGGTIGTLTMCVFASRSYEKGYKDPRRVYESEENKVVNI